MPGRRYDVDFIAGDRQRFEDMAVGWDAAVEAHRGGGNFTNPYREALAAVSEGVKEE